MVSEVNLSGVTMSGLVASIFAGSEYQNGFLIGEEVKEDVVSFNIFGILPFNFFNKNHKIGLTDILNQLGDTSKKVIGIYRCRERQDNRRISLNDFLVINTINARLFCLIENDTSNYIRVQQTFFLCVRSTNGNRSLRMIPFKIWSISDFPTQKYNPKIRLHDCKFENTDPNLTEILLHLIKNNVDTATNLLQNETEYHSARVKDLRALLDRSNGTGYVQNFSIDTSRPHGHNDQRNFSQSPTFESTYLSRNADGNGYVQNSSMDTSRPNSHYYQRSFAQSPNLENSSLSRNADKRSLDNSPTVENMHFSRNCDQRPSAFRSIEEGSQRSQNFDGSSFSHQLSVGNSHNRRNIGQGHFLNSPTMENMISPRNTDYELNSDASYGDTGYDQGSISGTPEEYRRLVKNSDYNLRGIANHSNQGISSRAPNDNYGK